jgi:hypothetical protein
MPPQKHIFLGEKKMKGSFIQTIPVILSLWSFHALATPTYAIKSSGDIFFYRHAVTNGGTSNWLVSGLNVWERKTLSTPSASQMSSPRPIPILVAQTLPSFRDWEGSWVAQWQYQGKSYETPMTLKANWFGIEGDYGDGTLKGTFVNGNFTQIEGEYINTAGTGVDCPSGNQSGWFIFNLSNDRKQLHGWWDVCGKGKRMRWDAQKSS